MRPRNAAIWSQNWRGVRLIDAISGQQLHGLIQALYVRLCRSNLCIQIGYFLSFALNALLKLFSQSHNTAFL
jgi:hypothetical protein